MNEENASRVPAASRRVSRKRLLSGAAGVAGLAAAGVYVAGAHGHVAHADATSDNTCGDTAQEIFTAALIAEDLATTFYYHGLVGPVIHDPNLAGKHGTATKPEKNPRMANPGNVDYLRAALTQEIDHANLLRALIGGTAAAHDPYQTFYFPDGAFDTLTAFTGLLDALENAFIGAYLTAVQEFSQMAADTKAGVKTYKNASGAAYASGDLEYFAKVAGSIMGVESEHRVLGRVISSTNPANNISYEQTDGLACVYSGSASAVVALTPFLGAGSGKSAYSFAEALEDAGPLKLPSQNTLPTR